MSYLGFNYRGCVEFYEKNKHLDLADLEKAFKALSPLESQGLGGGALAVKFIAQNIDAINNWRAFIIEVHRCSASWNRKRIKDIARHTLSEVFASFKSDDKKLFLSFVEHFKRRGCGGDFYLKHKTCAKVWGYSELDLIENALTPKNTTCYNVVPLSAKCENIKSAGYNAKGELKIIKFNEVEKKLNALCESMIYRVENPNDYRADGSQAVWVFADGSKIVDCYKQIIKVGGWQLLKTRCGMFIDTLTLWSMGNDIERVENYIARKDDFKEIIYKVKHDAAMDFTDALLSDLQRSVKAEHLQRRTAKIGEIVRKNISESKKARKASNFKGFCSQKSSAKKQTKPKASKFAKLLDSLYGELNLFNFESVQVARSVEVLACVSESELAAAEICADSVDCENVAADVAAVDSEICAAEMVEPSVAPLNSDCVDSESLAVAPPTSADSESVDSESADADSDLADSDLPPLNSEFMSNYQRQNKEKSLVAQWLESHKVTICPDSYGFISNADSMRILENRI